MISVSTFFRAPRISQMIVDDDLEFPVGKGVVTQTIRPPAGNTLYLSDANEVAQMSIIPGNHGINVDTINEKTLNNGVNVMSDLLLANIQARPAGYIYLKDNAGNVVAYVAPTRFTVQTDLLVNDILERTVNTGVNVGSNLNVSAAKRLNLATMQALDGTGIWFNDWSAAPKAILHSNGLMVDDILERARGANIDINSPVDMSASSVIGEVAAAIDQKLFTVAASDTVLKAGDETLHETQSISYVKLADVGTVPDYAVGTSNVVRVKWQMMINWVSATGYTRVFVNGNLVGAEKSHTGDTNWVLFTDDITGLKAGDVISIYGKISDAARILSVKQDSLSGTETVAHKHTQTVWS